MSKVTDHVRALLTEPERVTHEGRIYEVIPGPLCDHCKGTGYVRQHGMPASRFGPHMCHCLSCRRNPEHWLSERVQAKFVVIAIKEDPTILEII